MIKQFINKKQNIKSILNVNCKYYNCNYMYNYIKFNKKININQYNNIHLSICEKCGMHIYEVKKNT